MIAIPRVVAVSDISSTKRVEFSKTGQFRLEFIRLLSASVVLLNDALNRINSSQGIAGSTLTKSYWNSKWRFHCSKRDLESSNKDPSRKVELRARMSIVNEQMRLWSVDGSWLVLVSLRAAPKHISSSQFKSNRAH